MGQLALTVNSAFVTDLIMFGMSKGHLCAIIAAGT